MHITCQPVNGVCSQCGQPLGAGRVRTCRPGTVYPVAKPREPSTPRQVWSYSKAVANWKLHGSPMRTQEEIDTIFTTKCQPCPLFIAEGRPRCRLCGCSLNQAPDGLVNLIAMETEHCHDKPPQW